MSGILGGFPGIKSVQRGSIALTGVSSNTATISSVDPNNSIVTFGGWSGNDGTNGRPYRTLVSLALTNATTVTASRGEGINNAAISYEVIEFYHGFINSIQRGSSSCGGSSQAVTVSSVDVTKSMLTYMGQLDAATSGTAFTADANLLRAVLTNATTITMTQNNATASPVLSYQLVEFN